jgi:hypothetical protein
MAKKRGKQELDVFERCARDRLEPVLGPLREIDPGGGPVPLHDFEADLPDGLVAAVEVTSETEPKRQALDSSAMRFFSAFTLPGSGLRWLVSLDTRADLKKLSARELRQFLSDMEAQGRRTVNCRGDYRDPFVQRIRALRIESVYSWPAGSHAGAVNGDSGACGGWGWDGAATGTWLGGFFASRQGVSKLHKLGRANAAERHLVVVLDSHSQAGLGISTGLTDWTLPGTADTVLPSVIPPEPLTGMWLVPMVRDWLGLGWKRDAGWSILKCREGAWGMVTLSASLLSAPPARSGICLVPPGGRFGRALAASLSLWLGMWSLRSGTGRCGSPIRTGCTSRPAARPSSTWSGTTCRSAMASCALRERPCIMHRFSSGVAGEKVHQKRVPYGAPP